ncbi:PP2C family protein-serine/threonine phosphatase [Streptomyces sp. NPDC058045]|uniref:PP2C family protein-serine/threonine phosphatase n=1 Tax=Streptomyces sp. NPDC058045 TaxID=3346311 RepID=UPI0036E14E19
MNRFRRAVGRGAGARGPGRSAAPRRYRPDRPVHQDYADYGDLAPRQRVLRVRGRSVAWVPSLVLLMVITYVDYNTSGQFRVLSWIAVVPGIAAALCGVWTTAAFSLLTVITYIESDSAWPHQYRTGLPDFILVAAAGLLSTAASWVRVRSERRQLHLADVAETTRRTVLRPLPPGWGGIEHAAVYLAADSEARVGGDFYDIQPGPYGTRVLLGDVQGKGLGAVAAAAALLGTFREAGYRDRGLPEVARSLEDLMRRHHGYMARLGDEDDDRFATAVLLGFPPGERDGWVELVNFGHEAPLAVSPGRVRALPSGDGLPLGLGGLTDRGPVVHRVRLAPGETILLVTDGVTEARDGGGEFFPLRERVTEAVTADPAAAGPAPLVALVRDGTLAHCHGRLADDTTVFAVRSGGGGRR